MNEHDLISAKAEAPNDGEAEASSSEESQYSKYFGWSVPSLLLAVVTFFLSIQSVFWTEPGINLKYRELSKKNLGELKLTEPSFWIEAKTERKNAKSITAADERRLLDETTLALRRLIIHNTRDSWAHYQLGLVAAASAKWYQKAIDSSTDVDSKTLAKWRGEIATQEKKARDEMAIVIAIGEKEAKLATRWGLYDTLRELCMVTTRNQSQVAELRDKLNELARSESDPDALVELHCWDAKLRVLQALGLDSNLSDIQRRALMDEAHATFERNIHPSLECVSWNAEAMALAVPDKAVDKAREAVQLFFLSEQQQSKSPISIASAFKSLLLVGGMTEAERLVVNAISGPPTNSTMQLRSMASAASFRQMRSLLLGGQPATKNLTPAKLYGISFRLAPNSEWILSSVTQLLTMEKGTETVWNKLADDLGGSDDSALHAVLDLTKAARENDEKLMIEAVFKIRSAEPGLLGSLSSIVVNLVENESLSEQAGGDILRVVSDQVPDQLAVWFARVAFCAKYNRESEELACLEFLNTKVSDNEPIQERLQELRSAMSDGN